ncbi:MAG: DNA integrity scanning protein DisA nucleotide-binding domain protein [Deltaproteobacteria bacterium]|nr:DNA integrity scanning protein DisA nucleotide-binding domain protein [Deltaproteobacteria bacterium]MBI2500949.1 DNA integrity scanning protein DisA nucleotide-binding domain protein [Deltaproteobacteria bacterium]MBI4196378.1 DNA integrity scanning protein DisA nucleotide-binding domain protein [Deltaproteobacteria bacterium]
MVKKRLKEIDKTLISAAFQLAATTRSSALLIFLDPLKDPPSEAPPKGCHLIYVTCRPPTDMETYLTDHTEPVIHLPSVNMTRMGQIKMAVVLALSKSLIRLGDKIVFLTGHQEGEFLDSVVFIDTAKEQEIITTDGLQELTGEVRPDVFQHLFSIALELASHGREGKPVGTIFVVGDEEKVLQLSKQMIINPFKGYSDEEKGILSPSLRETIIEFSALDGAFVISSDGLVLSAGRYLGAVGDVDATPQGLGSRHIAAAGITALTKAIALVISESTGDLRIFKNGKVIMEIEKPTRR